MGQSITSRLGTHSNPFTVQIPTEPRRSVPDCDGTPGGLDCPRIGTLVRIPAQEQNPTTSGGNASRIEASRVLELRAIGRRAKTDVDPDPFKGSATEVARRLGVSARRDFYKRSRSSDQD